MGPIEAVTTCFKKTFVFYGRATRAEFRWFILFALSVPFVIPLVYFRTNLLSSDAAVIVLGLLAVIFMHPLITATMRRGRDINSNMQSIPSRSYFRVLWRTNFDRELGMRLLICMTVSMAVGMAPVVASMAYISTESLLQSFIGSLFILIFFGWPIPLLSQSSAPPSTNGHSSNPHKVTP